MIRTVPRHQFVDEAFAMRAYEDTALPIGNGQTISQPWVVARMTAALLEAGMPKRVLEIGTGSGYQAAVLAALGIEVFTVERIGDLLRTARKRFRALGLHVRSKHDDGRIGWADEGPFDGIIVTAAAPALVDALSAQLAARWHLGGAGRERVGTVVALPAQGCRWPHRTTRPGTGGVRPLVVRTGGCMKLFGPLYERALAWARHPKAPALLTGLSFAEAIVFPVMPEVMLAPMCLSQPKRGFWFASLSLAGSLAGAVVGYLLGHYAYELVRPLLESLGWLDRIDAQVTSLREITAQSPWKAFWLLVIAGFTPIPLKIFTWASGIVGVPMLPFLASMFVGRGKRVFLVALSIRLGGERAEKALHRYIEPIGWSALLLLAGLVGWLLLRGHAA